MKNINKEIRKIEFKEKSDVVVAIVVAIVLVSIVEIVYNGTVRDVELIARLR